MTMLIAAAAFFLGLHLLISGTPLRDVVVRAIGEGPFMGLFSVASLAGIVWLAMSYNAASASGGTVLWDLGPGVRHLGIIVVAIAFWLGVSGLLAPNPTAVRQEEAVSRELSGVIKITRHPFLWGVALWAAFHLAANGDEPSVMFFGTFLILAVLGAFSIDAKRARKMGEAWTGFAKRTSNIPFAAVIMGRASLALSDLFGVRQLAALGIFVIVLFAHAWLFSASPFPGGWVPF